MTADAEIAARRLRWNVYGLLIALSLGLSAGRILAVNSVDVEKLESHRISQKLGEFRGELETQGVTGDALAAQVEARQAELKQKLALQRPFLSGNDRSRWATVRSLVEHGTFAIDEVVAEPGWDTIDMVKHKDREGVPRLYSSKPPLTATLLAIPYWAIHRATGMTLSSHPYELGRALLILFNLIPAAIMYVLVARMVEKLSTDDWSRIYAVAAIALATLLSTFMIVLNNHLFGAVSVTIAAYAGLKIWLDETRGLGWFFTAGVFGAFAVSHELPALSFLGLLSLALLWKAPRPTLLAFAPGALLVVGAMAVTNYWAHNSLRPPYAHRSATDPDDNWYDYTFERNGREIPSYWRNPTGIDAGEVSRATYAFNVLVGHHGIFSLTPIWLLSLGGGWIWLVRGTPAQRQLTLFIGILSLVCLTFYLLRPQIDRNYGGMTSGFRWMFWFAPLWVLLLLPAVERLNSVRWQRGLALLLLGFSALSVSYPTWNPWTHPWLTKWFLYMDWTKF